MSIVGWLVIGGLIGVIMLLGYAACVVASDSEERERYWQHPPDDDGITIMKDEDENNVG